MKFEIIWWWEDKRIWIPLWIDNYEVRSWLYRYFVWMLIEPFLGKFWFDSYDSAWDESFSIFQTLIINCTEDSLKKYLEKNWFEVVWVKNINFKIIRKWKKDILDKYNETWDDFEMKSFLEKARNGELSFWFIPWENNWLRVIFAKHKIEDLEFFSTTRLDELQTQKKVSDLLSDSPTPEKLAEASKPWWSLHWFTL